MVLYKCRQTQMEGYYGYITELMRSLPQRRSCSTTAYQNRMGQNHHSGLCSRRAV